VVAEFVVFCVPSHSVEICKVNNVFFSLEIICTFRVGVGNFNMRIMSVCVE